MSNSKQSRAAVEQDNKKGDSKGDQKSTPSTTVKGSAKQSKASDSKTGTDKQAGAMKGHQ